MTVTEVTDTTSVSGKVIKKFTTDLAAGGGQDTTTWVCPLDVTSVLYLVVGGGGGGGSGYSGGGGGGGALLDEAAHPEAVGVRTSVHQLVDRPRVAVEGEDHRPVCREDRVEIAVAEPVRMLAVVLQSHQVDHVHHANF